MIIPALISLLKQNSTLSKLPAPGKLVPTCSLIASSNSLSSLSKIQASWLHFSTILWKKQSPKQGTTTDKKNRNHRQLQKVCHKCWLVIASFQMARMKVMLRAGQRRVIQSRTHTERQPPSQEELARWVEQLRGLEMAGRSHGSSPTRQLAWMVVMAALAPSVSGGGRPCEAHYWQEDSHQRAFKGWA